MMELHYQFGHNISLLHARPMFTGAMKKVSLHTTTQCNRCECIEKQSQILALLTPLKYYSGQ